MIDVEQLESAVGRGRSRRRQDVHPPGLDRALVARVWGEGPPILFLHGLGASSRYWGRLSRCSAGYRGIAPDLLGFGHSPHPDDVAYDVADHVAALAPLLPQGTVVVGHSTGAALACALARAHPGVVRALVLVGLPAFPDERTARAQIGRLGLLARWMVQGRSVGRLACNLMCLFRPLLVPVATRLAGDIPEEIAGDFLLHTWISYDRTLRNVVVGYRPGPDLLAAGVPTVLVHGRQDTTAPIVHVEGLAQDLLTAGVRTELREVDGDHHVAIRQAEVVARVLAEVLTVHARRPATER